MIDAEDVLVTVGGDDACGLAGQDATGADVKRDLGVLRAKLRQGGFQRGPLGAARKVAEDWFVTWFRVARDDVSHVCARTTDGERLGSRQLAGHAEHRGVDLLVETCLGDVDDDAVV